MKHESKEAQKVQKKVMSSATKDQKTRGRKKSGIMKESSYLFDYLPFPLFLLLSHQTLLGNISSITHTKGIYKA